MRWRASLALILAIAGGLEACQRGASAGNQAAVQAGAVSGDGATAPSDQRSADEAYARGAYDSALVHYLRVVSTAGDVHDTLTQARALTQAGLAAWRSGRYADARSYGERALALKISARLRNELPKSYNALGLLAHNEGRFSQAIEDFNNAEREAVAVGDSPSVAKARGNRGMVYSDIGDFPQARAGFVALRDFARAKADTQRQANALVNLGMLEIRAGAPGRAMPVLTEALRLERAAQFSAGEENALGQIGTAYQAMGDPQLAIAYLDSALRIAHEKGLRQAETDDLQLLAQYLDESGDHPRALALLNRAAVIADSLHMRNIQGGIARAQARALLGLADVPGALQHAKLARDVHAAAGSTLEQMEDELAIAELAARARDTAAVTTREAALLSARRLARSIDSRVARVELGLGEARVAAVAKDPSAVLRAVSAIRGDLAAAKTGREWEASALESSAYLSLDRLAASIRSGRAAVHSIEQIRAQLTSGPLRTSFTSERATVYETLVMALLRHGDTAEALTVADAARSRALLEHLSASDLASAPRTSVGDLVSAEQLLRRIDQLTELLRAADTVSRRSQRESADDQREFLSRRLAESRRDYETLMRRATVGDRHSLAIVAGEMPDMARVRAALGPDEALVEYFVADARLVMFVVNARQIHAVQVPIGEEVLSSRIRLARELSSHRESTPAERNPVLTTIYTDLIAPLTRAHLLDGIHTIGLVPHGALAYLPFAALIDPATGRYLIQSFNLFTLPSGSSLAVIRSEPPTSDAAREAAVFAPFPGELPGTRAEAQAIGKLGISSREFVGSAATESAMRTALTEPQIVHVATHGLLNALSPMFSRIELAVPPAISSSLDDGRLEVHEILDLTIRSPLVFLSGCETGSGAAWSTSFARGEDYATLAEAFLYAGARNVVSTLWRIDDRGAAEFASSFYSKLRAMNPVDALGAAQRTMLAGRSYSSPFYWSAYIVSGDARSSTANSATAVRVMK